MFSESVFKLRFYSGPRKPHHEPQNGKICYCRVQLDYTHTHTRAQLILEYNSISMTLTLTLLISIGFNFPGKSIGTNFRGVKDIRVSLPLLLTLRRLYAHFFLFLNEFLRLAKTRVSKSKTHIPKHAFSKHSIASINLEHCTEFGAAC